MRLLASSARLAALIFVLVSANGYSADAAPFCIRNQMLNPQCMYYDAQQCQQEAGRQNAECVANPAELQISRTSGEYCVVTSGRASVCAYTDQPTCSTEAARQHGACIPANQSVPQRVPDPYSPFNGQ